MPESSAVVTGVGAFVDGPACEPLWRVLSAELRRRQRDGGQVRPEIAEAVETLRLAASTYLAMSAGGQLLRQSADIVAPLASDHRSARSELTTDQFAAHLAVTPRHVRRLAAEHGIEPISANRWSAADVAALAHSRTSAA